MPIYEFYCRDCHTLFNFFASKVDTSSRPPCPGCGEPLERRPARFATLKRARDDGEAAADSFDDERLAGAMDSILGELQTAPEGDESRLVARALRRIGEASGRRFAPPMEELIRRLEAGEDADQLEEELGAELGEDGDLAELFREERRRPGATRPPRVDDTLYFL